MKRTSGRGGASRSLPLDTAGAAGQHLEGIASSVRVERVPQGDHGGQVLGGEELGHELHLLNADPVLTGHAPSDRDALIQNLMARLKDALHLVGVALVEE